MKTCSVCGAFCEDNQDFCGNCGSNSFGEVDVNADEKTMAVDDYASSNAVAENSIPPQEPTADNSIPPQGFAADNSILPQGATDDLDKTVAGDYAPSNYTEPSVVPVADGIGDLGGDAELKPKKNKKPLIIAITSIVLVIALVVSGILTQGFGTNWFGLGGPLNPLLMAVKKTLESESATLSLNMTEKDDGETYKESMDVRILIDHKNEDITYIMEQDDRIECLSEGTVYYYYDDDSYARSYEEDVEEIFDSKNKYIENGKINWKKLIRDNDLEDYIKHEDAQKALEQIYKDYLSDKGWLEEYLGFEKSGNVYTLEPDLAKLFKELINISKECDALTKDAKSEIKEELESLIDEVKEAKVTMTATISVNGGRISSVEVNYKSKTYNNEVKVEIELSDYNKTKISEDEIEDIKEKVEELTCGECGEFLDEDHGDCEECGEHGYLYEDDGMYYCWDCYDSNSGYDYCYVCDDYEYMYDYAGYDVCWDCYYDLEYGNDDYDYCYVCDDYEYMYDYYGYDVCWDCYYSLKYD